MSSSIKEAAERHFADEKYPWPFSGASVNRISALDLLAITR